VTDAGVAQLRHLRTLRYVHLSKSQISDESLRIFGAMPRLEGLSLQGNAFTDAGLAHLAKLNRLKELWIDLGDTDITDAGLEYLRGLKSLEGLAISDSHATPEGVAKLKQALPRLKTIHYSAATRLRPSARELEARVQIGSEP
jgi:internalin A